jgi:hypothetical protein
LALAVLEDIVAVALGDGFYVKGDWYRQERRSAGNAPRTRILNDSGSGTGGYRAMPRGILTLSFFAAVHSRKYV